ncbi:exonuclease domain-containing protein [Streptococcus sp. B01]|uniref:exonuclease domain-containing protein n=1 Tax=Streptococcus sp. B01 TaxID=2928734 RepID=UPI00211AC00F|nr:exonuclease domain-containing protein [Streptococcus sp. B01]MCQ9212882.1 3'-5' exoribonuclease [Streptococcus sp. B01]
MSNTYVALDIETANNFRGSICSIGLVKFKDGAIIDSFYSLINPEEEFDCFNIGIHGIHPNDVINAPIFPKIRQQLIDFIGNDVVVAHFAQFDMGALKDVYDKYSLEYDTIHYVCSYFLSKAVLPGKLNYKLNYLANELGFSLEHHNAISDAETCGRILSHLLGNQDLTNFLTNLRYKKTGLLGRYGFRRTSQHLGNRVYNKNLFYQPTDEEIAQMDKNHPLYGLHICFTGKLERMTRPEANKVAALAGAIPDKNVTLKTNILVVKILKL